MSISNAQPTLWAKMILRALNTLLVYNGPDVISRDYEGEIQEAGDSVKIISIGDPEVRTYTKDIRFVGYGTTGNKATLEGGLPAASNGFVGYAANFRVYQSNDVPEASTKFKVCAGHPIAWTYAEQISRVEAYSPEKRFAEAVK